MSNSASIQLHESWLRHLEAEFGKQYMQSLKAFLKEEKQAGKVIFPPGPLIFNALNSTPLNAVKVVIIGQDPYHGPGQAHGLSFSVPRGVRPPPSLQNIFKELADDCGVRVPPHGELTRWAEQGVLLLNASLTVEQAKANSHQKKGWEQFTDRVIALVSEQAEPSAFILWGSFAQKKSALIDRLKHCVIKSVHPSPLSAHRGFFGSKPFSQANRFLKEKGRGEIDWAIS